MQFRDFVDVAIEIGGIAVCRQWLKYHQNMVFLNCRRGVLTAKMWRTFRARLFFALLEKSKWSNKESLLELLQPRGLSRCGLIQLGCWYDRQRTRLMDTGCLRNDPHWVSSFLNCCSCMSP